MHPDGTEKEYFGHIINEVYFYAEDGYVYGNRMTDKTINRWNAAIDLVRCKPDGSDMITLFRGETLPQFDSSDYIGYYDITVYDTYISFTVFVHGYREEDGWRGRDVYTAIYQVNTDGSNLVLMEEKYSE